MAQKVQPFWLEQEVGDNNAQVIPFVRDRLDDGWVVGTPLTLPPQEGKARGRLLIFLTPNQAAFETASERL